MDNDSSEDEVFFGPITNKEKCIAARYHGRKTLILPQRNPLYRRWSTTAYRGQHVHHSLPLFKTITASAAAHLPWLNLPPKRPAMSPSIAKKTRKSLTLKVKLDFIQTQERREN
ncbi:hypothetical protein E2C01_060994 [Portunus trituberculatus]|uniref:Uncharacterized protein n=1 Tax=Portunus trituberculatus TaxID=210409 RepID=A0A5B7HAJ8_PORTR|nr:hypothetical protein [Portunus trituberculatus]